MLICRYCQKKGPDVTTSEKYLKVSFLSDKKKHGYGAVCRMECVAHTTVAPTTEVTGMDLKSVLALFF